MPWPQTPRGFTCISKGCGMSCEEEIDQGGPFGWKGTLAPCTVCLGRACLTTNSPLFFLGPPQPHLAVCPPAPPGYCGPGTGSCPGGIAVCPAAPPGHPGPGTGPYPGGVAICPPHPAPLGQHTHGHPPSGHHPHGHQEHHKKHDKKHHKKKRCKHHGGKVRAGQQ